MGMGLTGNKALHHTKKAAGCVEHPYLINTGISCPPSLMGEGRLTERYFFKARRAVFR